MRRIGLAVVLVVSLLLAPLVAEAQQAGKVYRIGYLSSLGCLDVISVIGGDHNTPGFLTGSLTRHTTLDSDRFSEQGGSAWGFGGVALSLPRSRGVCSGS